MRNRILYAVILLLACSPLFILDADPAARDGLALRRALTEAIDTLDVSGPVLLKALPGVPLYHPEHTDALRAVTHAVTVEQTSEGLFATPEQTTTQPALLLFMGKTELGEVEIFQEDGSQILNKEGLPARGRVGNQWALLPPLLAILLAFLTRNTLGSLFLGVLLGGFMLVPKGAPFVEAFHILFVEIIWRDILLDSFHFWILGFVLLLSATVAVVTRMGGIEGMVKALTRFAKTRRSAQGVAYSLGLSIFFDDYANSIIVGNSTGPLMDKLKVGRAKLAYIVDSTAAPMAGLAALSTWVAFQVSTFAPQLPAIGIPAEAGYGLFLESIPFRFYCVFALIMVGLTIWMKREFGPMLRAETRACHGLEERLFESDHRSWGHVERAPWTLPRWENGVIPIAVMILVTSWRIYQLGAEAALSGENATSETTLSAVAAGGFSWLRVVLAHSDASRAIFDGSLASLSVAALLALGRRQLPLGDLAKTTARGSLNLVKDGVLILILAWTIGNVCERLDTAGHLVVISADLLPPTWLPIVLFLTACFVAFATGSSWTTMSILQPNVVVLADRMGEASLIGSEGMLLMCIGAVLEGAIFGDHCSPISDTTILSSASSRCDLMTHVRTQAPYALVCAGVALAIGYVPTSFFGFSPFLSMGIGLLALILILQIFGRNPETESPAKSLA